MSQHRFNPRTQRDDWYYRIKESFRDLTGRVRCRVMLNVGFIDEPHRPEDIRDIGKCLTYLHEHQGEKDLFGNPLSNYNEFVQRKTQEFWHDMVQNGSIDAVKATIEESREKAERLVDVKTIKHTDAREIGAEWVCLQAIRELEYRELGLLCEGVGYGVVEHRLHRAPHVVGANGEFVYAYCLCLCIVDAQDTSVRGLRVRF